jgi:hypothetical protein
MHPGHRALQKNSCHMSTALTNVTTFFFSSTSCCPAEAMAPRSPTFLCLRLYCPCPHPPALPGSRPGCAGGVCGPPTIALVLVLRLDYYRSNRRPPFRTLPFLFAVSDGSVLPRHTGRRSVTIKKSADILRRTRFRPRPRRLLWDSRDQKPKATFAWRRKRAVRSRLCSAILASLPLILTFESVAPPPGGFPTFCLR